MKEITEDLINAKLIASLGSTGLMIDNELSEYTDVDGLLEITTLLLYKGIRYKLTFNDDEDEEWMIEIIK